MIKKIVPILIGVLLITGTAYAYFSKANYSYGTLGTAILNADTTGATFTVTNGTNAGAFPATNFNLTVYSASCSQPSSCASREIINISSVSGTTFTIGARNQEGTTHSGDWAIGTKVTLAATAAVLSEFSSSLDTDGSLTANSDSKVASQKATKTYVDSKTSIFQRYGASGQGATITTASTVASSNTITVADATSWANGYGIAILGGLASDNFNDTNATLLQNHTGQTNATWVKNTNIGTQDLAINSNMVGNSANNWGGYYDSGWTPPNANYSVQATFYANATLTANDYAQVMAREASAANTYYAFQYNNGAYNLVKLNAGTYTLLGTYAASFGASGTSHILKITVNGTTITGYLDGTQRAQATDSAISAAGYSGIGIYSTGLKGTNFTVLATADMIVCPKTTWNGTVGTMYQSDGTTACNATITGTFTVKHDDTYALQQAMAAGNVYLKAGSYNVTGSAAQIFSLNTVGQVVFGEGSGTTIINNRSLTADVFNITRGQIYLHDIGIIGDWSDYPKTAGYGIRIGDTNGGANGYLMGTHIYNFKLISPYAGIYVGPYVYQDWIQNGQIIPAGNGASWQNPIPGGAIVINNPSPAGDIHWDDLEAFTLMQGSPCIAIYSADTQNFSNIKCNISDPPLLINAGAAGNPYSLANFNMIYNLRFVNNSYENGDSISHNNLYDVSSSVTGTGAVNGLQFLGGEVGVGSQGGFFLGAGTTNTTISGTLVTPGGSGLNAIYVNGATNTTITGAVISSVSGGALAHTKIDNSSSDITISGSVSYNDLSYDSSVSNINIQGNRFEGGITSAIAASVCGSTPSPSFAATSTDFAGQITLGGGSPTACTLTFSKANFFGGVPWCWCTPVGAATSCRVSAQSANSVTFTLNATTTAITYGCTRDGP